MRLNAKVMSSLKKHPGRLDFVRANLQFDATGCAEAVPTRGQDSHMISGLAKADSLVHFARTADRLADGELATLDVLKWWP